MDWKRSRSERSVRFLLGGVACLALGAALIGPRWQSRCDAAEPGRYLIAPIRPQPGTAVVVPTPKPALPDVQLVPIPSWPIGQPAVELLPNYVPGTAQFLLLPRNTAPTVETISQPLSYGPRR
jgi:hypothetical protein